MRLRSAEGALPAGTHFVEFTLTNRVVTGQNDASADNLSFVLTPTPAVVIMAFDAVTNGWQVEFASSATRAYALERSQDFGAWTAVTSLTTGTGQTLVLVDTNAPASQAFYRVRRQP
jgi:hypothetical protein